MPPHYDFLNAKLLFFAFWEEVLYTVVYLKKRGFEEQYLMRESEVG